MSIDQVYETIVERAVTKAIQPLCNRIESLEKQLSAERDTTRLTDKQVGAMLNLHEKTVGIWRRDGKLGVMIENKRVIRVCDVEDYKRKIEGR